MMNEKSSRLPGFYQLPLDERIARLAEWAELSSADTETLLSGGLSPALAGKMVENSVGIHALPLGIAANFVINGRDYLIPMVVEEPSVIAGVSFAAKLVRDGGGFATTSSAPLMIGQVQLLNVPDLEKAVQTLREHEAMLLQSADSVSHSIVRRGGGSRRLEYRILTETPSGRPMLIVHLLYDCLDAMGANAVNTAVEHLAPQLAELTGGQVNLRILSNLSDQRTATAHCRIPHTSLQSADFDGKWVAERIVAANDFAIADPYRAATHNKGIMNGVDAVCLATGNDWRAIEAGAHAYAARNGRYASLTAWQQAENGDLLGELTMPMAVGIVGGATKVHPTAQLALKIMGIASATQLAEIMVAVGLAQNLAAIRALATSGIQAGHMKMHARQVALAAGAPEDRVQEIADQLVREGNIKIGRAQALLQNT